MISIILPIYKFNLNYIIKLLDSLHYQTFKNFEVIISDDEPSHSTNLNFSHLISQYKNINIKYLINNGEKGIFSNINFALRNANGFYFQFICQDDYFEKTFLEEQIKFCENDDRVGLVFSNHNSINEENKFFEHKIHSEIAKQFKEYIPSKMAINYLFAFGCIPRNLSPVMVKRVVFEELGFFNAKMPYVADFDMWIRIAEKYDFAYNKSQNVVLRTHSQRASNTLGLKTFLPDALNCYKKLLKVNTINKPTFVKIMWLNYLFSWKLKEILVSVLGGNLNDLKLLRHFFIYPLNPFILVISMPIILFGRFKWFFSENDCNE